MDNILDLSRYNKDLIVDEDLYEYAEEQGFDVEKIRGWSEFCEFWEIYEEWKEDVSK